jgi:3'(2'), 5'-bisphosphate nucleotidase
MVGIQGKTYERELAVAIEAVREAAKLCDAVQSAIGSDTLEKKDRSPVTVADFGSQALICQALGNAFPADPIIAEEDSAALRKEENRPLVDRLVNQVRQIRDGADEAQICNWIDRGNASSYSDRFWTLDPIDGTKGFLRGDQYAISLALVVDGQITVAALGCPNLPITQGSQARRGICFYAVKGQGAFELPMGASAQPAPIHVSDTSQPAGIRFCESVEAAHSSHGDAARIADRLGIMADSVRIDSQAKYAMVARGQAEAYLRLPKDQTYREKIWDHAGGALVVTEAGGRVTDIHGKALEFTHGRTLDTNKGVIVTNGKVHDAILETIDALDIGRG